jgi:hypothetical protein
MNLFRRLLNAILLNSIIYRHNTRKEIDQLAFKFNLVEALFQQFADTEHKVPGHRAAENIILQVESNFFHIVPPSGKKCTPQRCVV